MLNALRLIQAISRVATTLLKRSQVVFLFFFYISTSFGDIYVCIPFFNEFRLLDMQLHELSDSVDHFVIHEAVETFAGTPKQLFFGENKERYQPFLDKITLIQTFDRINVSKGSERDFFQKNQLMRGLNNCKPDDLILLSDCDEIVPAEILKRAASEIQPDELIVFRQRFFSLYMNLEHSGSWFGPVLTYFKNFKALKPAGVRQARHPENVGIWSQPIYSGLKRRVVEGGWHFSTMGGREALAFKIGTFAHQNSDFAKNFRADPQGFYEDLLTKFRKVPIDSSFPRYLLDNLESFQSEGLILD